MHGRTTKARRSRGFLHAVFAGGVDIVQIRQKDMKPEAELAALEIARQAAGPYQGIVCVNDSPELAGRFQADMLHLGQADGSAGAGPQVPASLGAHRPVHPCAAPDRQGDQGPQRGLLSAWDLSMPLLPSPTTSRLASTWSAMPPAKRESRRIKSKPWFAIGGISLDNLDEVIEAGARRVCVVRAITQASDPQDAAQQLSSRLRAAWKADPAMERYTFQALSEPASRS